MTEALENYYINSKLVWDCDQSLAILVKHNRVQMIWVLGHSGTEGNEIANQLERVGSESPSVGLGPASNISAGVAMKAGRKWTHRDHKKYWGSLTGLTHATRIHCQKKQGINETKQKPVMVGDRMIGLHTAHCYLKLF
jgi:hypothetical protein